MRPPDSAIAVLNLPHVPLCATCVQEGEEGEQEGSREERILKESDRLVAAVYSALPEDTLFIVCTCQGDTAGSRLMMVRYV